MCAQKIADVAVLDSSPIQALHRGAVLSHLGTLFERPMLCRSVADETTWSHRKCGPKLVPDLKAHPELAVCAVSNDVLRATMVTLFRVYDHRNFGRRASKNPPEVVEYQGKFYAWVGKKILTHSIPDLEVVVLAKQLSGVVIADDGRLIRAAADLQVATMTTREVIASLVSAGAIADASAVLAKIEATGYVPTSR